MTLTADVLRRVMTDMGLGPGWYTSADLYRWYTLDCSERSLTPVSPKMFGVSLDALGRKRSTRRIGPDSKRARCWFIPRHLTREAP